VIRSLALTDFRSYASASLPVSGGAVVLHGPNGAGKTNLLEAISLLTPGKGLRGATAQEMGRREPGEAVGRAWAVMVTLDEDGEEVRLGTGVQTPGAARRVVRIDGETAPPGRLLDHLRPVWATPEQDRLFSDARTGRREGPPTPCGWMRWRRGCPRPGRGPPWRGRGRWRRCRRASTRATTGPFPRLIWA